MIRFKINLIKYYHGIIWLNFYFQELNSIFKKEFYETQVRFNIISQTFIFYNELKSKLDKNNPLYEEKLAFYNPHVFSNFYSIILPIYLLNSNIYLFFVLRKDFSVFKYFIIYLFNILSITIIFTHTDKKLFIQYAGKPNPYAKFMRQEFLKNKNYVTEKSYLRIEKINNELDKKYKF